MARGALLARDGLCASDVGDGDGVVHAAVRKQLGVLVQRLKCSGRAVHNTLCCCAAAEGSAQCAAVCEGEGTR
eukprot:scaffold28203_cov36-Phaeocystis_antarctica.AAC.1